MFHIQLPHRSTHSDLGTAESSESLSSLSGLALFVRRGSALVRRRLMDKRGLGLVYSMAFTTRCCLSWVLPYTSRSVLLGNFYLFNKLILWVYLCEGYSFSCSISESTWSARVHASGVFSVLLVAGTLNLSWAGSSCEVSGPNLQTYDNMRLKGHQEIRLDPDYYIKRFIRCAKHIG